MADASIWKPGTDIPLVTNEVNVYQAFVATAAQTLFTLTDFVYVPNSDAMRVTVNGVMQIPGRDFTETSTSEVTLAFAADAGDDVVLWGVTSADYSTAATIATDAAADAAASEAAAAASEAAAAISESLAATYAGVVTVDSFDGTGAQVAFTLTATPPSENSTYVYVSGVYQAKGTYSVSGTTLTFSTAPPAGTGNIEVLTHTPSVFSDQYALLGVVQTFTARNTFSAGLTVTGDTFISRGITDNATAKALTLSGSGANSVTIANSATNPTIGTSAGSLVFTPAGLNTLVLTSVASAVNYVAIVSSAAGNGPSITTNGSDATIPLYIASKGAQAIFLSTNGGATAQVAVTNTASADRYLTLTGSFGGNPTIGTNGGALGISATIQQATADAGDFAYFSSSYAAGENAVRAHTIQATSGISYKLSNAGNNKQATMRLAGGGNIDFYLNQASGDISTAGNVALRLVTSAGSRYVTITADNTNPTIGTSAGSLNLSSSVNCLDNLAVGADDAPGAGGVGSKGLFISSSSLMVLAGSGAPSISAAKGSLYLRTDGSTTNNRMYVNTDGGTTWTAVTTVA